MMKLRSAYRENCRLTPLARGVVSLAMGTDCCGAVSTGKDTHAHGQRACILRLSFCTGPEALDLIFASINCEKKAEAVMKSDHCKDRTDIAGQFLVIEWHVCLGNRSVPTLRKL